MQEDVPPKNPRRDAYQEAQRRLREHPGHVEHLRIQAFVTTLVEVFDPNWQELISLLNEASTNPDVAFRVVQDIRPPEIGHDSVVAQITRRLHNYVASAMTLVDHCRRLTAGRSGEIISAYEVRKAEMLKHPEVAFIQDLRNFSLHRSLPLLGHPLKVTQAGIETSEVQLSVPDLLQGDRWNAEMKDFITSHGDRLSLRPIIQKHYELTYALNVWLVNELQMANSVALAEANELVVASNAALMGVDLETARRRTEEEEARRRA